MGVGSWPRPGWLLRALHERLSGRLSDDEFQQYADDAVRPTLAVRGALLAYHDPVAAVGVDERYEFHVDGETFTIDTQGAAVAPSPEPDLVITAPARSFIDIRQHRVTFGDLLADGIARCTGPDSALTNLRRIYRLDSSR